MSDSINNEKKSITLSYFSSVRLDQYTSIIIIYCVFIMSLIPSINGATSLPTSNITTPYYFGSCKYF